LRAALRRTKRNSCAIVGARVDPATAGARVWSGRACARESQQLCVDCCMSQPEAILCNGIECCPHDLPVRRVPVQAQCHTSLKPPAHPRVYPRWKDVTFGVSRECVKSALAAAENVDRFCRRITLTFRSPIFKPLFWGMHRVHSLPVSREANAACQKETGGQRDLFPGSLLTLCS
jgi:hypothetical protein